MGSVEWRNQVATPDPTDQPWHHQKQDNTYFWTRCSVIYTASPMKYVCQKTVLILTLINLIFSLELIIGVRKQAKNYQEIQYTKSRKCGYSTKQSPWQSSQWQGGGGREGVCSRLKETQDNSQLQNANLFGYQISKSIVKTHFWNNIENPNLNWVLDDIEALLLILLGDNGIVVM